MTLVQHQPLYAGCEPYPGYRLRQLISRGGFGEVWEAETSEGATLALKFLPANDPLVTAKEIRAIQAIRQLRHVGLVHIEQVWTHLGYIIIAMELAEGSLLDLLEAYQAELGTPVAPEEIVSFLTQVAAVLDFLNARQHIIDGRRASFQHCDVKPSNVLLFGDTAKLCDFGLSTVTGSTLRMHYRAGTLDYAAPEVFQGRLSDWTDQYALAVTYFQLRTGTLPFHDTPAKFVATYARPAPELGPLSKAEQRILARALASVPQDRWPTCREFISRLTQVIV
jgi:serine/threonine protein kinase